MNYVPVPSKQNAVQFLFLKTNHVAVEVHRRIVSADRFQSASAMVTSAVSSFVRRKRK